MLLQEQSKDAILATDIQTVQEVNVLKGTNQMNTNVIREAEKLLTKMTRAEKAQILQWVVRDLGDAFAGIDSRPDVCGGEPHIVRTRIPVWVLVRSIQLGMSEADLLRAYPTLRAEDLANAWAYFRAHREEIERQVRENEEA